MNDSHDHHSPADITRSDLTGRTIGDLQILKRLGRGGMADVYVANQVTLGRRIALKVLRRDLARDPSYVERFRREARAAAGLSHPNIVQIYEVGCLDKMHYISQEFVDGVNLRQQLDRTGPLTGDQAVVVLQSVAEALVAASDAGITHRDIKPENIMISRRGEVKVADFGLAAVTRGEGQTDLTQVGMTMGTPLYMSPEQVQGAGVDVRSDLYSLGVTMYHLLVGRPPFEADTPLALAVKHLHETAQPIESARPVHDLPGWLCQAIEKLMEKSPDKRFQSPQALSQFLASSMSEEGPIGDATATLTSKIDATKTLQRLMQVESGEPVKKRAGWRLGLLVLPLLAIGLGLWLGRPAETRQLSDALQSDLEVREFPTIEEQYLEAARLNEPEGWQKVAEVFPPAESPVNAAYAAKSAIQLARLYRARQQYQSAERTLNQLLADPDLSSLYRGIALYELMLTQEERGEKTAAAETKTQLRRTYKALQSSPNKQRIFEEVVRDEDLLRSL